MIPNKKMKVEEALELLDGWQNQLVHGKTYFRDIADVIRDLGVDVAAQKVQLQNRDERINQLREALLEVRDMIEMCLPMARVFNVPQDGSPAAKIDTALEASTPNDRSQRPACSAFPIGSRWRTADGMEITVIRYYEVMPGCWRLVYDGPNGIGGHMGQNHIDRLTPLDTPNAQVERP